MPLPASAILDLWEAGHERHAAERALQVLAASEPGTPPETLAALPIGQRDARLLALRGELLGDVADARTTCPACGEVLEFQLSMEGLRAAAPDFPPGAAVLERDDVRVEYRLPTSSDLLALRKTAEPGEARRWLAERCLLSATRASLPISTADLPGDWLTPLAAAMAERDPQADVALDLACPACAHTWSAPFDIVSFLLAELDREALRLLGEVHALARAYGWSEGEILRLSEQRRRSYLELVEG